MGTTANAVAKIIVASRDNGVIDLTSRRAVMESIREAHLDKDRVSELIAKGHDPAHAVLIFTQNLVSLLSEALSELKPLRQFCRIVAKAEDEYMPSYPPVSPVTTSFFTMWALFDLQFGQSHETIGTCIQTISKDMPFPGWIEDAIGVMQASRMGFYVHCGFEERYVRLREIGTGAITRCFSSSGYQGQEGQIWFVRLVAPSNALVNYHVVKTTPYVLVGTTENMIEAYLAREITRLGNKPIPHDMDAHSFIMKHGPSPTHWNEYVFCAYSNFQEDAVFLSGVPDMKESLPCAS